MQILGLTIVYTRVKGIVFNQSRAPSSPRPLQDGASICTTAIRFAFSSSTVSRAWWRFQETRSYSRRYGLGLKCSLTPQKGSVSTPSCKEEQDEHGQRASKWPNNPKQTSRWWPQGPKSSIGPCVHCPALWSPIGIAIEYQNCQVSHCHHVLFTDGQQVHPQYMWKMWKGLEKQCRTLCCL